MENLNQIILRWERQGIKLLPPPDADSVARALSRTGKRFSADVVRVYELTGGTEEMDSAGFTLWPLSRVAMMNIGSESPDLAFADCLIDSFWFEVHYEDAAHSSVYGGYDRRKLAADIDQLFGIYLTQPNALDLYSD